MGPTETSTYFCDHLFCGQRWHRDVRLEVDGKGWIVQLAAGASPEGAERVPGWVLPGLPDLHSHAHQRAMAGLAERSGPTQDTFWTWREVMYGHLLTMTPEQLEAFAAQLYLELVKAGYTAVGEFQYLHHDPQGRPYAEAAEMSLRCQKAARAVGIGLTHLPVLYAFGGFGEQPAGPGQLRFLNDLEGFLKIVERLQREADAQTAVGIAPHSLRAVSESLLRQVLEAWKGQGPIHMHVAEQRREVEECLAWSGQRPMQWLLERAPVGEAWCLIHCTQLVDGEIRALAASGAVAGLCPTTEANLGDGFFAAAEFLGQGGRIGIGTDSQISLNPVEELRWLEYAQRLQTGRRNVLAGGPERSTGRRLFEAALAGGAQACGRPIGRLEVGKRADFLVLDGDHPLLWARQDDEILDSWIFAGNANLVRHVVVGGQWIVKDGYHAQEEAIGRRFRRCLKELRGQ